MENQQLDPITGLPKKPNVDQEALKLKYEAWKDNDWHTLGIVTGKPFSDLWP